MDDDKDDKSLVEKTIKVKDMASSVTDAAKSAATPSEEEKMTVMDVPLVADAAAMPMPLVASKKREAPVKRAPPKKATAKKAAKKTSKKSAAKKSKKAAKRSPAKKTKSSAGQKAIGKKKTAKKVAKKKKVKKPRR